MEAIVHNQYAEIVHHVLHAHDVLSQQKDLTPHNPIVAETFASLRSWLTLAYTQGLGDGIAFDSDLEEVKHTLAKISIFSECAVELFWCQKFLEASLAKTDLTAYSFYPKYEAIWSYEKDLFLALNSRTLVFLGSGPLPLTAIFLAQKLSNLRLECVERDAQSANLSKELVAQLGLADRIRIHCCEAVDYSFKPNQAVFCSTLLEGKKEVYEKLVQAAVPEVLVRDIHQPFSFLYHENPMPPADVYVEKLRSEDMQNVVHVTKLFMQI